MMTWNIKIRKPNGIYISGPGFHGETTFHINDVKYLIIKLQTAVEIFEGLKEEGDE